MDVTEIPFVKKAGVIRSTKGVLELPFNQTNLNHLHTIHASAQFTLAETASGEALQTIFPELVGKVVPVLRDSQVKFKKPATKTVSAHPMVSDEAISKFREQFNKKGRSSITVDVEITDSENVVTCIGTFNWFVQSIERIKDARQPHTHTG